MKREDIFSRDFQSIQGAHWYRQRFDACPHFMFFLGDAHISSIQHTKYPFGQRIAYTGFSRDRADWYHAQEELEFTARHVMEAARHDPQVSKKMIADFLPWQEAFYTACSELDQTDLTSLSPEELLATYNNLKDIYTKKLNSSPLIDGFALSTDTVIAEKIRIFLQEKGKEEKFVEYFAILTAPPFRSFLQEEEIALRTVAEQVALDSRVKEKLLAEHQKRYFWIRNNYVKDHVEPIEHFRERLEAYSQEDSLQKKKELEGGAERHRIEKEKCIAEIELPEEIVILLTVTDDFNAWQDERKKGTFFATHYFSLLLEEFARRTQYSLRQLKYAFPPEMGEILNEKINKQELDQRYEYCMIVWKLDAYDVTTDQELISELDRIGTGAMDKSKELSGFVASRGKIQGKVKILESASEIGKIEEGDILVAVMTRPDYLPAMQKAAAFVTDEGGITCHAAIVAREMKKPCIIGTKTATKVLKDGDMVEVDADKGVVKIVK